MVEWDAQIDQSIETDKIKGLVVFVCHLKFWNTHSFQTDVTNFLCERDEIFFAFSLRTFDWFFFYGESKVVIGEMLAKILQIHIKISLAYPLALV